MKTIEYRGYSIEPDYVGYSYWKTSEGIDCSNDGDGWKSNVGHESSVQYAKDRIDEIIYEETGEEKPEEPKIFTPNLGHQLFYERKCVDACKRSLQEAYIHLSGVPMEHSRSQPEAVMLLKINDLIEECASISLSMDEAININT